MPKNTTEKCCEKCESYSVNPDGIGRPRCCDEGCPCHTTTENGWERNIEHTAANIVYQIGDLLYETLPPDVAHEHFVTARQATNDKAIAFAEKLIQHIAKEEYERGRKAKRQQMMDLLENHRDAYMFPETLARFIKDLDALEVSLETPNEETS